jgi:hypothetical protein
MKQLPDEKTLLELLSLAIDAEQKAKALCDLTAEIDEKWRKINLNSRNLAESDRRNSRKHQPDS